MTEGCKARETWLAFVRERRRRAGYRKSFKDLKRLASPAARKIYLRSLKRIRREFFRGAFDDRRCIVYRGDHLCSAATPHDMCMVMALLTHPAVGFDVSMRVLACADRRDASRYYEIRYHHCAIDRE